MVAILLLLALARALGELAERGGLPAMIGEIVAGIVFGPSMLGWLTTTPELRAVSDLGVFLLVVLAGMEIDPAELRRSVAGRNAWIALSSFFIPLLLGLAVGWLFRLDTMRTVFLGLCIAITALPVSVRTLIDLNLLKTDVGQRIISAAIFNDVLSLLGLGVILNMPGGGATPLALASAIMVSTLKAGAFIVVVVAAYRGIQHATRRWPRFHVPLNRALGNLKGRESLFAVTIVFVLIFAALSEAVGLHFIVGAFFGAMLLSREMLGQANFREVERTTSSVTMGFLAPVFFGMIGLEFDVGSLTRVGLALAVLATAFAGKIFGGYLGGRLAGLPGRQALALGIGLNGRGIMELVIANIAFSKGFIGPNLFSVIVLVGVVTTVATPLLLRRFAGELGASRS
jgi:Kef-type K+ transport system membrane component KefB